MSKIIAVDENVITIGTDDGTIKEVRPCDVNFVPQVGDKVEIFETETKTVVTKVEDKTSVNNMPAGGININMNNQQTVNAPNTVVANGTIAVNKVVYCILAFFLGWCGAHKFYSHRIGAGICYLIFCWTIIPGFIAFIEFIVALCKKSDANGMILV